MLCQGQRGTQAEQRNRRNRWVGSLRCAPCCYRVLCAAVLTPPLCCPLLPCCRCCRVLGVLGPAKWAKCLCVCEISPRWTGGRFKNAPSGEHGRVMHAVADWQRDAERCRGMQRQWDGGRSEPMEAPPGSTHTGHFQAAANHRTEIRSTSLLSLLGIHLHCSASADPRASIYSQSGFATSTSTEQRASTIDNTQSSLARQWDYSYSLYTHRISTQSSQSSLDCSSKDGA